MIGAICLQLNENIRAKLYAAGTYENIDWKTECSTELGDEFKEFKYINESGQQSVIQVARNQDGSFNLRLIETKWYVLNIEDDNGGDHVLPSIRNRNNKFLKYEKDRDSVRFQFINYLGRSKIQFKEWDRELPFEVIPDKMDYEDDYIKLTESLAEICSELLLDYAGPTSSVYTQSEEDSKLLLEQFIFLRRFCYEDNIQGLVEAIKRNPDRILEQDEEIKPLGSGRISKSFYKNPFSCSRGWINISGCNEDKGAFLPQMISVTHKTDKLDTPANRFLKYALHKFDSVCENLVQVLDNDERNKQTECWIEAKAIHNEIENILMDSFFDEIGNLQIMPQNNQVLQKREGYSQIFSAYMMLDLALQLDWKGKDNVYEGESKNVALLYEYWLFFELYRIVKSINGCIAVKTVENPFIQQDDGLKISLQQGIKSCQLFEIPNYGVKVNLYYNRTFSRAEFKTTRYEGSYSKNFRPDYTLAVFPDSFVKGKNNGEEEAVTNGAVSYTHFDAKYRISDLTSIIGDKGRDILEEEELEDDKIESVVNTYKNGDLLKMHTYNDAIRRTIGSYVLYPGADEKAGSKTKLFHIYDEILPGVGAFSIRPNIRDLGEQELKSFIVSMIETVQAENSRLNRFRYYAEMILREPSVSSGQAISHSSGHMKKGDLYVIGYIQGESDKDYYNFLKKNGFLNEGKEFIFFFNAIKGKDVYSHHKDIFKAAYFRFYANKISETKTYKLEPVVCKIISNELISKSELVNRLKIIGFHTDEDVHHADFYYILKVKVEDGNYKSEELKISEVNQQNANDTFSPDSPKVMVF